MEAEVGRLPLSLRLAGLDDEFKASVDYKQTNEKNKIQTSYLQQRSNLVYYEDKH